MTVAVKRNAPTSALAVGMFALAVVAFALSVWGGYGAERQLERMAEEGTSRVARHLVRLAAFVLPVVLGLAAGQGGALAMRAVERSNGNLRGDLAAAFAILLGLLAAVQGAIQCFANLVWPLLPDLMF